MRRYPSIFLPKHKIGVTEETTKKSEYQGGPAKSFGQDHADDAGDSENWHRYKADYRKECDEEVSRGSITLLEAVESLSITVDVEPVDPGCHNENKERTNRYSLERAQRGHYAP